MAAFGENLIGTINVAPFFKVTYTDDVSIDAPENRKGDALRT